MHVDMEEARGRKAAIAVQQVADTTWLSTIEDFERVYGRPGKEPVSKHYLMDRFYRAMREKTGYLMRGGKPEGGQFSFDADNRKPYRGKPAVRMR
jgi:deoxyribodipyrimidine photolyase-related protein